MLRRVMFFCDAGPDLRCVVLDVRVACPSAAFNLRALCQTPFAPKMQGNAQPPLSRSRRDDQRTLDLRDAPSK